MYLHSVMISHNSHHFLLVIFNELVCPTKACFLNLGIDISPCNKGGKVLEYCAVLDESCHLTKAQLVVDDRDVLLILIGQSVSIY